VTNYSTTRVRNGSAQLPGLSFLQAAAAAEPILAQYASRRAWRGGSKSPRSPLAMRAPRTRIGRKSGCGCCCLVALDHRRVMKRSVTALLVALSASGAVGFSFGAQGTRDGYNWALDFRHNASFPWLQLIIAPPTHRFRQGRRRRQWGARQACTIIIISIIVSPGVLQKRDQISGFGGVGGGWGGNAFRPPTPSPTANHSCPMTAPTRLTIDPTA